jgi:hypothetical protein
MDLEEAKELLGDDLCDFCPWKNGEIDHGCDSLCEGSYCEEAYEYFMDENEQFFDSDE